MTARDLRRTLGVALTIFTLLFISGCGSLVNKTNQQTAYDSKTTGKVVLTIPVLSSSKGIGSVIPSVKVTLTMGATTKVVDAAFANGVATAALEGLKSGKWDVDIEATVEGNVAYASPSGTTLYVIAGQTTNMSVKLVPQKGTLTCAIDVTGFTSVDPTDISVSLTYTPYPQLTTSSTVTVPVPAKAGSAGVFEIGGGGTKLEPGSYSMKLVIDDSSANPATNIWTSPSIKVDIKPGATTPFASSGANGVVSSGVSFVTPPDSPSGVALKAGAYSAATKTWDVNVTWAKSTDDTTNTVRYLVYYKVSTDENWTAATSYTTATGKATYSQIIKLGTATFGGQTADFCVVAETADQGGGKRYTTPSQIVHITMPTAP